MVEPSGWQCHPFATEKRFTQVNFYFLILTVNDRKVRKIKTFLLLRRTFLDWDLHHQPVLLRLYCRFDSYRRRSFLAVMKIVSLPLFMQNCNFSDKFVSETGLIILILSAGMDACH